MESFAQLVHQTESVPWGLGMSSRSVLPREQLFSPRGMERKVQLLNLGCYLDLVMRSFKVNPMDTRRKTSDPNHGHIN